MDSNTDFRRNGSGYIDMTAYTAIRAADAEADAINKARLNKLLNTIFYICELADFHIENRLELKDKRTGKIWR